uniref:Uncharacterized protein n=1 Tax=Mycena chlorophos TaxID=658473 RepID=A0ABQ0LUI8_MYCCL|nr:predicted protein [Mycena chlorophos]
MHDEDDDGDDGGSRHGDAKRGWKSAPTAVQADWNTTPLRVMSFTPQQCKTQGMQYEAVQVSGGAPSAQLRRALLGRLLVDANRRLSDAEEISRDPEQRERKKTLSCENPTASSRGDREFVCLAV